MFMLCISFHRMNEHWLTQKRISCNCPKRTYTFFCTQLMNYRRQAIALSCCMIFFEWKTIGALVGLPLSVIIHKHAQCMKRWIGETIEHASKPTDRFNSRLYCWCKMTISITHCVQRFAHQRNFTKMHSFSILHTLQYEIHIHIQNDCDKCETECGKQYYADFVDWYFYQIRIAKKKKRNLCGKKKEKRNCVIIISHIRQIIFFLSTTQNQLGSTLWFIYSSFSCS